MANDPKTNSREAKLAEALRANLRRRKVASAVSPFDELRMRPDDTAPKENDESNEKASS